MIVTNLQATNNIKAVNITPFSLKKRTVNENVIVLN